VLHFGTEIQMTREKSTEKTFLLKFQTHLEVVNERELINPGQDQLILKQKSISLFPTGMTQRLSVTAEVFSSPQVRHVVSLPQLMGTGL